MARAIRLVRTARQENLDATTTSAKNAAVPLTPLDRMLGDLLAAALVKDMLEHQTPEPIS